MRWQTTLWIMVSVATVSTASFYFALPFIPLLVQEVGVHDPAAVDMWSGLIFSVNALTGALFSPLWGNIADRVGRKPMVVRSSIFGGLAAGLMALAPHVALIALFRALVGVAGGFSSAASALIASIVP